MLANTDRQAVKSLFLVITIVGLAISAALQYASRDEILRAQHSSDEETFSIEPHKLVPLVPRPLRGVVADWYWMSALQHVGSKVLEHGGLARVEDLSALNLHRLAPLLEAAAEFDPRWTAPYEYGAVVLAAVDAEAAINLVQKGIRHRPEDWRLRHHLGFILWQQGRFGEASAAYEEGAALAGAPRWMRMMAAEMARAGGSSATARAVYARLHEESQDDQVRRLALLKLMALRATDEMDALRAAVRASTARLGRSPNAWHEISVELTRAAIDLERRADAGFPAESEWLRNVARPAIRLDREGAPVDPTGLPYMLKDSDVVIDPRSELFSAVMHWSHNTP